MRYITSDTFRQSALMDAKITRARELITNGRILEAIGALKRLDSFKADDLFLLETRYKKVRKEANLGVIGREAAMVEENQIVQALLERCSSILEQKGDPLGQESRLVDNMLVRQLISSQKNAIRIYLVISATLIILALIVFWMGFGMEKGGVLPLVGALLIASLSGLPIREVVIRSEKISVLKLLLKKIEEMLQRGYQEDELERVNNLFWNLLEKSLLKG